MELVNSHPQIPLLLLTQDAKLGKMEFVKPVLLDGFSMETMFVLQSVTCVRLMTTLVLVLSAIQDMT